MDIEKIQSTTSLANPSGIKETIVIGTNIESKHTYIDGTSTDLQYSTIRILTTDCIHIRLAI